MKKLLPLLFIFSFSLFTFCANAQNMLYQQPMQQIPPQQGQTANQVTQVYPLQNAVSVAVDSITVTFAPAIQINAATVNDTSFMVRGEQTGWMQGTAAYNAATNSIVFHPAHSFFAGELITAEATKQIQWDSAGTMAPIRGFAWQFWAKVPMQTYGTMSTVQTFPVSSSGLSLIESVSDIDADGKIDFSVSANSNYMFYNMGDGINYNKIKLTYQGNNFSSNITPFNFSFSGYEDLFLSSAGVGIFYKNIDGRNFTEGSFQNCNSVSPATELSDMNNDGTPDLLTLGTGDSLNISFINDSIIYAHKTYYTPSGGYFTAFDANNDGALDIAVVTLNPITQRGNILIFLNNGYGSFDSVWTIDSVTDAEFQIIAADYDQDGWADILTAGGGYLTIYHNNQNGIFTKHQILPATGRFGGKGVNSFLAVADFNGDGTLDAAITLGGYYPPYVDSLYVLTSLNDGHGNFKLAGEWSIPDAPETDGRIKCGDVTGDGAVDILLSDVDGGKIYVLKNDTTVLPVSVREAHQPIPQGYALDNAVPDPASQTAAFSYVLPETKHVNLSLYNETGELVATLFDGVAEIGNHAVTYDCTTLPSGVYYAELQAGEVIITKTFTVTH